MGGAGIGIGSIVSVVIQPTAQSYGVFQFDDKTLALDVAVNSMDQSVQTKLKVCQLSVFVTDIQ
jgi:hypothetical protein